MTDVTTGITDLDAEIADLLRKSDKNVILAVNKVDNNNRMLMANEFWSLGFEETHFVSSITGSGTGEILDLVTEILPEDLEKEQLPNDIPKICVVGKPNVGKSSLINTLLGEERNIVTNIAGTTRDSIHAHYNKYGKEFILVDTAGIRKKSKVHEDLEFYSVIRAIKSIDEADVGLLIIDATNGMESQDLNILSLIIKRKKGVVVLVNKWDLVDKETNTAKEYERAIKGKTAPFTDYPIIFISVLEKQRIFKAMDVVMEVAENRKQRIPTSQLNEVMQEVIEKTPPPNHRGKIIRIKYITQLPTYYPSFAFFCNAPKHIKESYKNFLENQLRAKFNFEGVPINIFFREK